MKSYEKIFFICNLFLILNVFKTKEVKTYEYREGYKRSGHKIQRYAL